MKNKKIYIYMNEIRQTEGECIDINRSFSFSYQFDAAQFSNAVNSSFFLAFDVVATG